ncbi:hypothetical protein ACWD6Q_36025 [Streptomyces nigra]|uniref:hypothetical protein n=1 Tax=Streptomyces nigra TaxID=1827580 RepID=UPI0036A1643E
MSLAAWAILVASLSALFTGLNMLASWSTYRRVRPRIKIHVSWNDFGGPNQEPLFTIRFINRSLTPAVIEKLIMVSWLDEWLRTRYNDFEIIEGGQAKEIPPLGGIVWKATVSEKAYREIHECKNTEIVATLSNGTSIRTGRMFRRYIRRHVRAIWTPHQESLRKRRERALEQAQGTQLTFDDLSGGEAG